MSLSRRDSPFANSGLVLSVGLGDLDLARDPFAGITLQRRLEQAAAVAGGGHLRAPATRVADFLAGRGSTTTPPSSYEPGLTAVDLAEVLGASGLPLAQRLRDALRVFAGQLRGFDAADGVLVGVESRTSSPLRLPRDPALLTAHGVAGLYPTGEGAGYAGGIVSAALDGIRASPAPSSPRGSTAPAPLPDPPPAPRTFRLLPHPCASTRPARRTLPSAPSARRPLPDTASQRSRPLGRSLRAKPRLRSGRHDPIKVTPPPSDLGRLAAASAPRRASDQVVTTRSRVGRRAVAERHRPARPRAVCVWLRSQPGRRPARVPGRRPTADDQQPVRARAPPASPPAARLGSSPAATTTPCRPVTCSPSSRRRACMASTPRPTWPSCFACCRSGREGRFLELAPKYWRATRARLVPAELKQLAGFVTIPPAL
jgi:hypothetical protein